MDVIVTLRKQETCQVLVRNVPAGLKRMQQEWLKTAMSAAGKDWEEEDIEVDSVDFVPSGSDDLPAVDFK